MSSRTCAATIRYGARQCNNQLLKDKLPLIVMKKTLLGMNMAQLSEVALEAGLPRFAGGQMAKWIYQKRVTSIAQMTNISAAGRDRLMEQWEIGASEPIHQQHSVDGTVKFLFPSANGSVETVYIPDGERATLCVSCQVGCKMHCEFCMTGRQGFHGHLSAAEILNQIYSLPQFDKLTNIVFMGQGEPMDNLEAVLTAIDRLTAQDGFAWSPHRITVSTVGVGNQLVERFLNETECHLAVSLHHSLPQGRAALMPAERAFPVESLIHMLRRYDWTHQRRLTFEYIVFAGENDTPRHARALLQLLRGLHCRVNLIRFHTIPGSRLRGADEKAMEWLRDYLTQHGLTTTIRASRGEDIMAACGLLNTAVQTGSTSK